ncbi:MAG TPA: alpha/beta family hydrolase [Planctomycetota bacterium]|nr:alpha/beta family hydrolase [Planctomycetota bacterium]
MTARGGGGGDGDLTAIGDSGESTFEALPASGAAVNEITKIQVRDRWVHARVTVPDLVPPSTVPALVIAPGQAYHMDLALTRGLFERVAAEGWIAVRFDWSFYTTRTKPSKAYASEVEELQAVIDHTRALPGCDRSRLYIVGKSLGAGIALERAAADPSIRGVILLTPPIHSPKPEYKMGTIRPRLERLRQPSLIVVGERDPLCELGRLYTLLSGLSHAPHLAVVGGDHSLRPTTPEESGAAHVELALSHAVDWLKRQSTR